MTLTIKIKFGNAAMQFSQEAKDAIAEANIRMTKGDSGSIRDLNGNTVGSWKVG